MSLSYAEKLARIRTGLDVVKIAEQKADDEARQVLMPGDAVWVAIGSRTERATVVDFEGGMNLRVDINRTRRASIVHFSQLIG